MHKGFWSRDPLTIKLGLPSSTFYIYKTRVSKQVARWSVTFKEITHTTTAERDRKSVFCLQLLTQHAIQLQFLD
jgi:hypothetical protein